VEIKYLLSLLCLLNGIHLFAKDSLLLIKKIPITAVNFTTDVNGNAYLQLKNNTIIEYSKNGDSITSFNEVRKGKISKLDVTNPLAPLLFIKNYSTIIHLDNMLSVKNSWSLIKKGYNNISQIAASTEGNIWIYDDAKATLIKLNAQQKQDVVSPLRQQYEDFINPKDIIQSNQAVFIIDTTIGVIKFDLYGTYSTTYSFISPNIQILDNTIVYTKDNTLISYNTKTLQEKKLILPTYAEHCQVQYQHNRVYIATPISFNIYTILEEN
jgi:hypothetical protein